MEIEYYITSKHFSQKPNKTDYPIMEFDKKVTSLEEFIHFITSGYGYICSVISDKSHISNKGYRKTENFKYSYFVALDIDDSKLSMEEAFDKISLKPTFSYNSYSNDNENKTYKFRFVYIFSKPIENQDLYYELMLFLKGKITEELGIEADKKAIDCVRYFNGTMDKHICKSDIIYDSDDLIKFEDFKFLKRDKIKELKKDKKLNTLEKFFFNNNLNTFLESYKYKITPSQTSSVLPIDDENVPFVVLPKNFREIKRLWIKSDGKFKPRKIKDGEHRRKKLFINGIIRRLINPNLSFDDILYALSFEMVHFIDNSEDTITKKDIWNITYNVMIADLEDEKYKELGKGRKTAVNPNFVQLKNGKSKRDVIKSFKSFKRYIVGSLYKLGLNDQDQTNYINEFLKDNDIDLTISKDTVRRYRLEKDDKGEYLHPELINYDFKKSLKDTIKLLFNDFSSVDDLLKGLQDNDIKISRKTLYNILNDLGLSYKENKGVQTTAKKCKNGASNIIKKASKHNDGCNKITQNDKNGSKKTKIIELIKENFDKCKSSKELLNLLIDNNLKISRRTLFTILKSLNLSFTQSAKRVQNSTKTVQKQYKILPKIMILPLTNRVQKECKILQK